ncbi:catechol 2,3-dioxygenase-like lactoylglutathione lyase family enzyme [Streptomyces achromogenes]|uniref:Catechol 2,3-dioxygenase-like lactoylglutathione lyase family enzyme n=1 Tax=Streptomyces achromogenes TaxID=67255 RepID=A0ABU0QCW0_STRAH|nr:VOC family protein [Streptomyces achromogenes]MDQ0688489.1 catechol 2,3-dioxygenase-like lactoylglutathione lyase family enzyme [Streptomyces achromogenes]
MNTPSRFAGVRYLVDDVQEAIDFYTGHLGFTLRSHPAFADVTRGPRRLLLSGPASSGARVTPGGLGTGGNRIHLVGTGANAWSLSCS